MFWKNSNTICEVIQKYSDWTSIYYDDKNWGHSTEEKSGSIIFKSIKIYRGFTLF